MAVPQMKRRSRPRKSSPLLLKVVVTVSVAVGVWVMVRYSDPAGRQRRLRFECLATALREHERYNDVLPHPTANGGEAFSRLECRLPDGVSLKDFALWSGPDALSSQRICAEFGSDFIIAAEDVPVRSRIPLWVKTLYVLTADYRVALVRCGEPGNSVVGTHLSRYRALTQTKAPLAH